MELVKEAGVKTESVDFAKRYTENVILFVEKVKNESTVIKTALEAMPNYNHASNMAMLTSFIAEKYNIETHRGHHILGFSAFFHDIGLYMPKTDTFTQYEEFNYKIDEETFKKKINSKTTPKNEREFLKKVFMQHPSRGGKLMSQLQGVSPVCGQIICQHHMRTDESGFPAKRGNVHPLALAVGICEEFITAYSKTTKPISPLVIIEDIEGFPNEIKNILASIFKN